MRGEGRRGEGRRRGREGGGGRDENETGGGEEEEEVGGRKSGGERSETALLCHRRGREWGEG